MTLVWLRWIAPLLLLCGLPEAFVHAALSEVPAVEVEPGKDAPPLSGAIRYTKRIGGLDVPIERVLELPLRANPQGVEHFGTPGQRTALVLRIRNAGTAAGTWILTTGRGSLRHFKLYEVAGERFTLLLDGSDPVAAQENLTTYQAFSKELVLEPGETRTIVIDLLSENSTYMPLRLETYGTFFRDRRENIAMVSGVVLAVCVLIFLNFVFFSVTGYREFGWLALAQTFMVVSTVHAEGYLTIFLLADKPLLGVAIEDGVKCAFAAAMAQFARSFLHTRTRTPRLDASLLGLVIAGLVVIALQLGLPVFGPAMRGALHSAAWIVTGTVALYLPVVGWLAMRSVGRQLWPLLVGWASLALFIIYGAVASMGLFSWLPINWHLIGPVGFFEQLMVTLALGFNLRKIRADQQEADARYASELAERLRVSERAARLADEREVALAAVDSQNALLHASGHDSRQVILALSGAIKVLERQDSAGHQHELIAMLKSSVDYLSEIAATTMSGAAMVGGSGQFVALSAFRVETLVEPLLMMFRNPFTGKALTLEHDIDGAITIVSDRPLLMRAIANLLSNSHRYTETGGARLSVTMEDGRAIIEISDTGCGMDESVVARLMAAGPARVHGDDAAAGTGSGIRAARQIVERLGGTLSIVSARGIGTTLQITLCCAYREVTPCTAGELAAHLGGRTVLDFDRRAAPDEEQDGGNARRDSLIAATYDDTSTTRARLSAAVGMMLIKPLVREMAEHPALARGLDQP